MLLDEDEVARAERCGGAVHGVREVIDHVAGKGAADLPVDPRGADPGLRRDPGHPVAVVLRRDLAQHRGAVLAIGHEVPAGVEGGVEILVG